MWSLAAIDGALTLAARSLTRAVAASLLEPAGELRAGNAILNVAFTGGAALGPALAGLVVAGFGVQTALLLDAVSFYVVAWILFTAGRDAAGRARSPAACATGSAPASPTSARSATLRRLLVAQGAAFVFFSAVIPVEVIYAKETLGAGDSGYGLMLASWGVGMVLGSLVFAAIRKASLAYLLLFSTLAVGAGYLGHGGGADPGRRLCRLRGRRRRQRGPVGLRGQRRAGADGGRDAGAGDERAGVDRCRDARARVRGRRHDRCVWSTRGPLFWSPVWGCSRSSPWQFPPWVANGQHRLRILIHSSLDEGNAVVLELIPGGMPIHRDWEVQAVKKLFVVFAVSAVAAVTSFGLVACGGGDSDGRRGRAAKGAAS